MRVDDFDFDLPEELIALRPSAARDGARLLHLGRAGIAHHVFTDLPNLLRADDVLVLNDTKVFPAQLTGNRPARAVGGGGPVSVDVTLLAPGADGLTWRAFARPAKRLQPGDVVTFGDGLSAEILSRTEGEVTVRFGGDQDSLMDRIHRVGQPPLPPYIARRRAVEAADRERYQTVYARDEGSVAAPTAGLHFTDDLLRALGAKGVEAVRVTLHVGAGTFLPVSVDDVDNHKMHAEWGQVSETAAAKIQAAMDAGRRIVCVGTTSCRLLESAATGPRQIAPFMGETDIFIKPGFDFSVMDALITNFHLPRSTLLMLISAFAGRERVMAAYAEAIAERYRFFSYGDACLLEKAA